MATGASAVFLLWPMFVAGTSDFATPEQREFLAGRLRYIGDELGIRQAYRLIKVRRFASRVLYIC